MKKRFRVTSLCCACSLLMLNPLTAYAAQKSETLKVPVEGFNYNLNLKLNMDDQTKTLTSIDDLGATDSNGATLSGTNLSKWKSVWDGMSAQMKGKNATEIMALDAVSGATTTSNTFKSAVSNALASIDSSSEHKEVGDYLQPVNAKVAYNAPIVFKLNTSKVPAGSDYYTNAEWFTLPGKDEQEAYYANQKGTFDKDAGTYTLNKAVPGQKNRVLFKDRNGKYDDIMINLEVEKSLDLVDGKLTSNVVDISKYVGDIYSVSVKAEGDSYGKTLHASSANVFRGDGYVNESVKYSNKPVFETGKTYTLKINSKTYGDVEFTYTATGKELPKVEVTDDQAVFSPDTVDFASSAEFPLKTDGLTGAKYSIAEILNPNNEPLKSGYGPGSYSFYSNNLSISQPIPGTYTVRLTDESATYADVTRTVTVTPVLSIENNKIVSSSDNFNVSDYIGNYNDVIVKNVTTGEEHLFKAFSSDPLPVSRQGEIDRTYKIDGKMLFNATDEYEITIVNNSYANPALSYKPVGITIESEEKVLETIPFETIEENDDTLPKGETKVVTEGVDGKIIEVTSYTAIDGVKVEGTETTEQKTVTAVNKVVKIGTKEVPVTPVDPTEPTDPTNPTNPKAPDNGNKTDDKKRPGNETKPETDKNTDKDSDKNSDKNSGKDKSDKKVQKSGQDTKKKAPKTGDTTNAVVYVGGMAIALSALTVVARKRNKNRK